MPVYSNNNSIKNQKRNLIISRVGIGVSIFFGVVLICLIFNILSFLSSFLLGTFGLLSYAICIAGIVIGIMMARNIGIKATTKDILFLSFSFLVLLLIIHVATTSKIFNNSYGQYIALAYKNKYTCGGVILSLLTYPIFKMCTHIVATYVILAIIEVILLAFTIVHFVTTPRNLKIVNNNNTKESATRQKVNTTPEYSINNSNMEPIKPTEKQVEKENIFNRNLDDLVIPDNKYSSEKAKKTILPDKDDLEDENSYNSEEEYKKAKSILGLNKKQSEGITTKLRPTYDDNNYLNVTKEEVKPIVQKPQKFLHSENEIVSKPQKKLSQRDKENLKYLQDITGGYFGKSLNQEEELDNIPQQQVRSNDYDVMNDLYDEELTKSNYKTKYNNQKQSNINRQSNYNGNHFDENNNFIQNINTNQSNDRPPYLDEINTNFDNNNNIDYDTNNLNRNSRSNNNVRNEIISEPVKTTNVEPIKPATNTEDIITSSTKEKKKPRKKHIKYNRPPIDLLKKVDGPNNNLFDHNAEKARILEQTLEGFNVPSKVVSITKGPAITRFELQIQQGVSVKKVMGHVEDIAMALEASGDIRMEIPIPGKNAFGVEVPNESIGMVAIRDIIESRSFIDSKSPLTYVLGKDITGECRVGCINKEKHLLVAGQTGSGKSVCLNTMLISLLYKAPPEDVKIILVDPKRVEFTMYNGLPHLLIPKAITDIDKAISALDWLINEMERRYTLLSEAKARDIIDYNNTQEVLTGVAEKLPYILFVIDELNDFMMQNKKEVEDKIIRLTQKSRAAGIHLIVATQRPSVDVITGTIKGNLPCRIAFAVQSFADSKTILDQGGADKLLGKGDMLYSPDNVPNPIRIQGAYVSNEEVEAVVNYVKENNEADFDSDIEDEMFNAKQNGFNAGGNSAFNEFDPLMKDALSLVITTGGVSVSKLQRAFGLGFPRAGKIVDQMEAAGFISAPDSKKLRTVYITKQEFEERFGENLE